MTEVTRVVLIMEYLAVFGFRCVIYRLLPRLHFEVSDCSLHRRCISDTSKYIVLYTIIYVYVNTVHIILVLDVRCWCVYVCVCVVEGGICAVQKPPHKVPKLFALPVP